MDDPHGAGRPDLDNTASLLARIREGNVDARERLFARVLPVLRSWAHRRLPASARDALDTDDLVQVVLLRALVRLDDFEYRGEGAFLAYLRQILLNAIRERIRRTARRPGHVAIDESVVDRAPSALESAVSREALGRYQAALNRLEPELQLAVVLRFEFEYSYEEIAEALGRPSPDAARMMVSRARERLVREMGDPGADAA